MAKQKVVIAGYIPVLHRGYLQFFKAHSEATKLYIFDDELVASVGYLHKDLRALSPGEQLKYLRKLDIFKSVSALSASKLTSLDGPNTTIIMPDEDVSRLVAKRFKQAQVEFYPIFLRWDRQAVEVNEENANVLTTDDKTHQKRMAQAHRLSERSSDIWRHIGAVLYDKNGRKIGEAYNRSEPDEQTAMMDGDPRNTLKRKVGIEVSIFTHAEAKLIADAARKGVSLKGASLYATTFPCPPCAKLVAHSGISTCYYDSGYATVDGERVMKAYGVKIVKVVGGQGGSTDKRRLVPYKK